MHKGQKEKEKKKIKKEILNYKEQNDGYQKEEGWKDGVNR